MEKLSDQFLISDHVVLMLAPETRDYLLLTAITEEEIFFLSSGQIEGVIQTIKPKCFTLLTLIKHKTKNRLIEYTLRYSDLIWITHKQTI